MTAKCLVWAAGTNGVAIARQVAHFVLWTVVGAVKVLRDKSEVKMFSRPLDRQISVTPLSWRFSLEKSHVISKPQTGQQRSGQKPPKKRNLSAQSRDSPTLRGYGEKSPA